MTPRERRFAGGGDRDELQVVQVLPPAGERRSTALRRKPATPAGAVEHPAYLDRVGSLRPVVVPDQPNAADETAAVGILGGPETEALVPPGEREEDLIAGALEIESRHVLQVVRLSIDLGERLPVLFAPLP